MKKQKINQGRAGGSTNLTLTIMGETVQTEQKKRTDIHVGQAVERDICTGCGACWQICPQQGAIRMERDELGFLRPVVDEAQCIFCGLCVKACDAIAFEKSGKQPDCYAARHVVPSEVATSRSGGFFMALCRHTIDRGGVVCGCEMRDMRAVHAFEDTYEGCARFKGSKYVQSDMENCFSQCADYLKDGRAVLFSGTGCQVHGLLRYLTVRNISRDTLTTVDIVCHGVPSPGMFREYIEEMEHREGKRVTEIDFRDKEAFGWADHVEKYTYEDGTTRHSRDWTTMYYRHVLFRPSCYSCRYTNVERHTDFTIADYWGIDRNAPHFHDNRGVSLVMVHTEHGKALFEEIKPLLDVERTNLATSYQPQMKLPIQKGRGYNRFTKAYRKNHIKVIRRHFFPSAGRRFARALEKRAKRYVKSLFVLLNTYLKGN